MIRQFCAAAVAVLLPLSALAESGVYVPYSGIVMGTDGTLPVALAVQNLTGGDMACQASLAHWYSADLGRAAPGAAIEVALWRDPGTGSLNLMNEGGARMPVEAVWCGRAGQVHATRARIALPMAAGPGPARIAQTCRDGPGARIVCTATGD